MRGFRTLPESDRYSCLLLLLRALGEGRYPKSPQYHLLQVKSLSEEIYK